MSILASEAALKDYLLANDDRYRELAYEHKRYEARLSELSSLPYPNEEELIEETILKKKKWKQLRQNIKQASLLTDLAPHEATRKIENGNTIRCSRFR